MPVDATLKSVPQGTAHRSFAMVTAVRRIMSLCARAYAWLEHWLAADAAKQQLEMMNDRDLLDIGMSRADIRRAAEGASIRADPHRREWL